MPGNVNLDFYLLELMLVRLACVRCQGTKCPLLTAFFSLSLFSLPGYFSPRRDYRMILKICMGSQVTEILGFQSKLNFGGLPSPRTMRILEGKGGILKSCHGSENLDMTFEGMEEMF